MWSYISTLLLLSLLLLLHYFHLSLFFIWWRSWLGRFLDTLLAWLLFLSLAFTQRLLLWLLKLNSSFHSGRSRLTLSSLLAVGTISGLWLRLLSSSIPSLERVILLSKLRSCWLILLPIISALTLIVRRVLLSELRILSHGWTSTYVNSLDKAILQSSRCSLNA